MALKRNQIPRNKLNKGCEWPVQGKLQTPKERNWRKLQKTERFPVLLDWWNQHSKNGCITKCNLHVQPNSHQNLNDIHHRDWKIYLTVHLEAQKTVSSQGNTQQKEQCWRYHNTQLQFVLQCRSNKNNMVLAQKQIWRPVEPNIRPRNEFTQLFPLHFWQRHQKHMMDHRQPLQQMLLGKLDIFLQKTESRSMFVTLYKYQLKVD
jgi:hypothetical protein